MYIEIFLFYYMRIIQSSCHKVQKFYSNSMFLQDTATTGIFILFVVIFSRVKNNSSFIFKGSKLEIFNKLNDIGVPFCNNNCSRIVRQSNKSNVLRYWEGVENMFENWLQSRHIWWNYQTNTIIWMWSVGFIILFFWETLS